MNYKGDDAIANWPGEGEFFSSASSYGMKDAAAGTRTM